MRLAILFVSLGLACCAPVPVPKLAQAGGAINTEDGLLLLVPTVSADSIADGQPQKREIEYEVMAIPGELLRRQIRQISGLYNAPAPTPIGGSAVLGQPNYNAPAPVGGSAVLSTAGNILQQTGNNLNSIGDATVQNAGNAIQFITDVGQGAGATLAESAGSGLQYAGQLSGAVLRALLQIPAIKLRVIGKIIEESKPLTSAINDVVGDSSGDLARSFEANASIFGDALGLIIRLVQDTLALKGRIIANIGSGSLDFFPKVIDGAVKIGGAVFQSAGGVARAIGDGVGEIVQVGANANFPAKPSLPALSKISLPTLPSPVIPSLDLSAIFPSATPSAFDAPEPAPLPVPLPIVPAPAPVAVPAPIPAPSPTHSSAPLAPVSFPAPTPGYEYGTPAQETILTPAQPEQFYTIVN